MLYPHAMASAITKNLHIAYFRKVCIVMFSQLSKSVYFEDTAEKQTEKRSRISLECLDVAIFGSEGQVQDLSRVMACHHYNHCCYCCSNGKEPQEKCEKSLGLSHGLFQSLSLEKWCFQYTKGEYNICMCVLTRWNGGENIRQPTYGRMIQWFVNLHQNLKLIVYLRHAFKPS